jgi:uncharacterized MAPEG superfamily protein
MVFVVFRIVYLILFCYIKNMDGYWPKVKWVFSIVLILFLSSYHF